VITAAQLLKIMPAAGQRRVAMFHGPLVAAMAEFSINTRLRIAAFLAQLAHESGSLRYMEEIASGRAYDNRSDLGNTDPVAVELAERFNTSPGRLYKGRGPIQLTGYFNYKACGEALGLDLVNNPHQAAWPNVGFRIAGHFWHSRNLNRLADELQFLKITKIINGGYNGLAERQRFYENNLKVLS